MFFFSKEVHVSMCACRRKRFCAVELIFSQTKITKLSSMKRAHNKEITRLQIPLAIFLSATRTLALFPTKILITMPSGHLSGDNALSLINARVLNAISFSVYRHRERFSKSDKFSELHLSVITSVG